MKTGNPRKLSALGHLLVVAGLILSASTAKAEGGAGVELSIGSSSRLVGGTLPKQAKVPPVRFAVDSVEVLEGQTVVGTATITSYLASGGGDRPIVFAFNGGPGSASAWLQFGLLGPKVIITGPEAGQASGTLVPNPDPLLERADVIFVDPVSTGYSLPEKATPSAAMTSDGDAEYLSRLIASWLAANNLADRRIFLVGESYGAQRIVDMAHHLQAEHGGGKAKVLLGGLVLVSQSIGMINTLQRPNNDQGTALGLPTIALIAWYHKRASRDLSTPQAVADRALDFVYEDYLPALVQGRSLGIERRDRVIAKLVELTGLPSGYFRDNGLAITKQQYLDLNQSLYGVALDKYDGRVATPVTEGTAKGGVTHANMGQVMLQAATRFYHQDLRFPGNRNYKLSNNGIGPLWRYADVPSYFTKYDYIGMLDQVMRHDGALKLMIVGGYFDTTASYGADQYLISHLSVPPRRLQVTSYPGGHMFYLDRASAQDFVNQLKEFVRPASGASES